MRGIPYLTFFPNEDSVAVRVQNVVSPWKFYIILENCIEDLQTLTKEMCETYGDSNVGALSEIPRIGDWVAVELDSLWFRAQVMSVPAANRRCNVQLVDHGRWKAVSVSRMRTLAGQFLELPRQAVEARLAFLQPVHEEWSPDAIECFKSLLRGQPVDIVVATVTMDRGAPKLGACLRNRETQGNLEIELIYRKLANFIGGRPGCCFLQDFPQDELLDAHDDCEQKADKSVEKSPPLLNEGRIRSKTEVSPPHEQCRIASVAVQTMPVRILPALDSDFYVEQSIQTLLLPP